MITAITEVRDITDNNANKGSGAPPQSVLQHTCRSVQDVIVTLNGVTLEGADAVMFTPQGTDNTPREEEGKPHFHVYGAILSSDDTFNRAFDWQAAQKHTKISHMDADVSIEGVFSCKTTDDTARWTLRNVEITYVNRNVDLLEPGTDIYQFQASAEKA